MAEEYAAYEGTWTQEEMQQAQQQQSMMMNEAYMSQMVNATEACTLSASLTFTAATATSADVCCNARPTRPNDDDAVYGKTWHGAKRLLQNDYTVAICLQRTANAHVCTNAASVGND